jgi:hypothetical protein
MKSVSHNLALTFTKEMKDKKVLTNTVKKSTQNLETYFQLITSKKTDIDPRYMWEPKPVIN